MGISEPLTELVPIQRNAEYSNSLISYRTMTMPEPPLLPSITLLQSVPAPLPPPVFAIPGVENNAGVVAFAPFPPPPIPPEPGLFELLLAPPPPPKNCETPVISVSFPEPPSPAISLLGFAFCPLPPAPPPPPPLRLVFEEPFPPEKPSLKPLPPIPPPEPLPSPLPPCNPLMFSPVSELPPPPPPKAVILEKTLFPPLVPRFGTDEVPPSPIVTI